jgi:hypothetical protein
VATTGNTPTELTGLPEDIATANWVALVTALRRVLGGDRDRERLLAGLDNIGTAILDRLSTHRGRTRDQRRSDRSTYIGTERTNLGRGKAS